MKIKGAIFDLDGTLIDSMAIWANLGENYLISRNIAPPENLRETMQALSLMQAAQYFLSEYHFTDTEEEIIEQFNSIILHDYTHLVPVKPHVLPFLQKLSDAGVKMCVATANSRPLVEVCLARLKIAGYFDFIITCKEAGCGKDDPVIFSQALERLHTKIDETVVFEDALYAIRTAKAAGFTVIAVYDKSAARDWDTIKQTADGCINSFDEWEDE